MSPGGWRRAVFLWCRCLAALTIAQLIGPIKSISGLVRQGRVAKMFCDRGRGGRRGVFRPGAARATRAVELPRLVVRLTGRGGRCTWLREFRRIGVVFRGIRRYLDIRIFGCTAGKR